MAHPLQPSIVVDVPVEITFRDVERTPALDSLLARQIDKLERVCDHLSSCRVAIERPQRHQRSGNPYRVRVDMRVPPGHEIVAAREPTHGDLHEQLERVVLDVFDAARRQLVELVERQRAEVKHHDEARALVVRLFPEAGYGFLKTPAGRELYFHRNAVLHGDFEALTVGTEVRFAESEGEAGPQASSVQIVGRPGRRASDDAPPAATPPPGWRPRE